MIKHKFYVFRKTSDFAYGKFQFKVISIRKPFESKLIWEENDRQNFGIV